MIQEAWFTIQARKKHQQIEIIVFSLKEFFFFIFNLFDLIIKAQITKRC